ncbi:hypothetical protein PybrP1_007694, partial [[Pythium] brassicae (nom. inval.)]
MMTSVDFSGRQQSARFPPPPQQRPLHPLTMSPAAEAGRMKTEQVVLELLYKAAELVFNLDIEEAQCVRDAMAAWREDVHLPLAISIYADAAGAGGRRRVLLEQWSVVYAPLDDGEQPHPLGAARRGASPQPTGGAPRDVIQQLKEVCKKISVLLRTLYAFMRLLPAHRLFRRSYPSTLSYAIHAASSAERAFEREDPVGRYSFVPISTPFGTLTVAAVYRLDGDALQDEEEAAAPPALFKENFIIQDYVPGSPELMPQQQQKQQQQQQRDTPRVSIPSQVSRPIAVAMSPDAGDVGRQFEQFGAAGERRRRSTPVPAVDDGASRRHQNLSQPMAIPQTRTPTVFEESVLSPTHRDSVKAMQHAHSYGDPERLRAAAANPNVIAAPYGYGNVAIERGGTPPAAHWGDTSGGAGVGGGTSGFALASYQDESSHFPLSTPPRHPNSLQTLKTSRTFSASANARRGDHDTSHHDRPSLDNFSLNDYDSHNHSPSLESFAGSRREGGALGSSPRLTPPFMYAEAPRVDSPSSTAALVLRGRTPVDSTSSTGGRGGGSGSVPVFASSPPFQANPTELLSTSPGYSYGKNFIRTGPSSLPMFVTTDQFQLGRHTPLRLNHAAAPGFSKSAGSDSRANDPSANRVAQARGFSSDLYDAGSGVWGVSPDSPDAFGLTLAGPNGTYRHRFLSSSSSTGGGEPGSASQYDPDDISDLMLPFAIGDMDANSAATTLTSTAGSEADRPSAGEFSSSVASDAHGSSSRSGASWDTASVGSFLNQLKNAPRLQMFQDGAGGYNRAGVGDQRHLEHQQPQQQLGPDGDSERNASTLPATSARAPAPPPQLLFEDELASFRSLRDELA